MLTEKSSNKIFLLFFFNMSRGSDGRFVQRSRKIIFDVRWNVQLNTILLLVAKKNLRFSDAVKVFIVTEGERGIMWYLFVISDAMLYK